MKKKLIYVCLTCIFIVALMFIYSSTAFHESAVHKGFPIPKSAKFVSADTLNKYEQYDWRSSSADPGVPVNYSIAIKIWGWKQYSQEGDCFYYEKQGQKISVISQTHYLFISSED